MEQSIQDETTTPALHDDSWQPRPELLRAMQEIATILPVNADAAHARDVSGYVLRRHWPATACEIAQKIADALNDDLLGTAARFACSCGFAKRIDRLFRSSNLHRSCNGCGRDVAGAECNTQ